MLRLTAVTIILAITASAWADQPSYSYIEGGYQRIDLDGLGLGIDVDGDGFGVAGSFEVGEHVYLFGGYSLTDLGFGIDLKELHIGAGYHVAISDNTSFFTGLSLVRAEVDVGGFGSADDDGFGVTIGLRSNISARFEAEGSISYVDLGGGADGLGVSGAAWYRFTDTVSLGFKAGFDEDIVVYGIAARYYFGR